MMKKYPLKKYLILAIALIAISWDISVSTMNMVDGTFKKESEFDALTGATVAVGLVTSDYSELTSPVSRTVNPTYAQIEEMVGQAIDLQDGFDGIISKGDKVLIKVNLVGANSPSGQGENTDVRIVKALIKYISVFTEGDVTIQIAEGTARSNDDVNDSKSVWANSGYLDLISDPDLAGISFSLLNLNQTVDDLVEVDLGSEGTSALQGSKYSVHKAELEADVYIAVPVLKIHDTGITNALKLQIGTAPGCYYGYNKTSGTSLCPEGIYHGVDQRIWTTEAIVDLCNIADIDFVVVDAIMCLELQKTNKGYNQIRLNTVLAGVDPVSVDHISAKLMGLNPDDVAHITLAEKVGLGTNDRAKIYVHGVPLEDAMVKVKKNQTTDGKFGQSNRTWLLSQAYEGTSITEQYIANEAQYIPQSGENGWSEPIFFFDDRIDLLNYYSGKTNMVSYAFTDFDAPKDQEAELWLGTHEAIYVYINGVLEYSFTSTSSYGDDDRGVSKKIINIKKGRNTLLVKTLNKFGDYSFALNICEVESDPLYAGNRVEALKFYIDQNVANKLDDTKQESLPTLTCYPNPIVGSATIGFQVLKDEIGSVNIYDMSGKLVRSFAQEMFLQGNHQVTWDLTNNVGSRVQNGFYLCKLELGHQTRSLKLLVSN